MLTQKKNLPNICSRIPNLGLKEQIARTVVYLLLVGFLEKKGIFYVQCRQRGKDGRCS